MLPEITAETVPSSSSSNLIADPLFQYACSLSFDINCPVSVVKLTLKLLFKIISPLLLPDNSTPEPTSVTVPLSSVIVNANVVLTVFCAFPKPLQKLTKSPCLKVTPSIVSPPSKV